MNRSNATFSPDRIYRYTLFRQWSASPNVHCLAFIGLNPSTADEVANDPTVTRCINFAKKWGFNGMWMLNLFAFRSTDPKPMLEHPSPVGPANDEAILRVFGEKEFSGAIACWGNHGKHLNRHASLLSKLPRELLFHLGLTHEGFPKHPLYLSNDTVATHWRDNYPAVWSTPKQSQSKLF